MSIKKNDQLNRKIVNMKGKYNVVEIVTHIDDGKVDTYCQRMFTRYFNPTRIQNTRSHFEEKSLNINIPIKL